MCLALGLGFGVFDSAGPTGDVRELVNVFGLAAASAYAWLTLSSSELISRAEDGEAIRNAIEHFVPQQRRLRPGSEECPHELQAYATALV
jgi:hypothetical protein